MKVRISGVVNIPDGAWINDVRCEDTCDNEYFDWEWEELMCVEVHEHLPVNWSDFDGMMRSV